MPPEDFSQDRECLIASVKSITDSQYGKKVQFMISGYPHEVSCFTKFPDNMSTGAKVFGHIEVKDGKYHNFKFGKRNGPSSNTLASDARVFNLINLKLLPLMEFMAEDMKAIRKQLLKGEVDYPQPEDIGIDPSQSPF